MPKKRYKPGRKVSPQWFHKHDVEPHILVLKTEGTAESVEPGRLVTKGAWASSSGCERYEIRYTVLIFENKQDMMTVKLAYSDYILGLRGLHMPDSFWRWVWPWTTYVVDVVANDGGLPSSLNEGVLCAFKTLDASPKAGCLGVKYPWDHAERPIYQFCFSHKEDADYLRQNCVSAVAQYELNKWPS